MRNRKARQLDSNYKGAMKRVVSSPPPQSNQALATSRWHGSLSATACTWRENTHASETSDALLAAGGFALFTLFVVAPVYFLGIGIAGLVAFAKGQDPDPSAVLLDPALWLPVVGSSAMAGLVVLFMAAMTKVVAFSFDSTAQQFEYTEKGWFLPPITKRVPFESIVQVIPTLMTSYATTGHFDIRMHVPGGRRRSLWLGYDIPLATLEAHSEWLSVHLGKRVAPVLRLDC